MNSFVIAMAVICFLKAGANLSKLVQPSSDGDDGVRFVAFLIQVCFGAWAMGLLKTGGAA